jgi:1,4-alpha-glucan branching enzyme
MWTVTVPLPPGKYTYNFVVDGSQVMPDPAAPRASADEFGTPASIVTVAGVQS